jgi:hypothetical protein
MASRSREPPPVPVFQHVALEAGGLTPNDVPALAIDDGSTVTTAIATVRQTGVS